MGVAAVTAKSSLLSFKEKELPKLVKPKDKKCNKQVSTYETAKEISCFPLIADYTQWDLRPLMKNRCMAKPHYTSKDSEGN
jgi:hypothetical protein